MTDDTQDSAISLATPSGNKRWYVVHAYSGMEKSVQRALTERITRAGMQDKFGQILVPTEEVVEMKNGQKAVTERRFFSGLRAGRDGNDRRYLALGEEHQQGYRFHWR